MCVNHRSSKQNELDCKVNYILNPFNQNPKLRSYKILRSWIADDGILVGYREVAIRTVGISLARFCMSSQFSFTDRRK